MDYCQAESSGRIFEDILFREWSLSATQHVLNVFLRSLSAPTRLKSRDRDGVEIRKAAKPRGGKRNIAHGTRRGTAKLKIVSPEG